MNATSPRQSVAAGVASLPTLKMKDLWQLWDQHFPRRPNHNNRAYVEGRVAFKIQEQELGGIRPDLRKQLIRIGADQSKLSSRRTTDVRLVPGTVLVREYHEQEHRVTALADGRYEYEGQQYKSLSAVARQIAGCPWSGPVFFGLSKTKRRTK